MKQQFANICRFLAITTAQQFRHGNGEFRADSRKTRYGLKQRIEQSRSHERKMPCGLENRKALNEHSALIETVSAALTRNLGDHSR